MPKFNPKVQLDARIDQSTYQTLKRLANADGRTVSNYVNKILTDFVTNGAARLAVVVCDEK
jgi:uncharacterized protein (DUF1778 family)